MRQRTLAAAEGLIEQDRQGGELVFIGAEPIGKIFSHGCGVLFGVLIPFGAQDLIEMLVIEFLLFFAADGVEEIDQRTGENVGGFFDEDFLGSLAGGVSGIGAFYLAHEFERFFLNDVGVNGV